MSGLDWLMIVVYGTGLLGLGAVLGRRQHDEVEYYLQQRRAPWWAAGLSSTATRIAAIGFISVPEFIAFGGGRGLSWLQIELAVPLATIVVMVFLVPFFRRLELVTVYEYLERRFGLQTRLFVSGVFMLSRGLIAGVALYVVCVLLAVCLHADVAVVLLITGGIAITYTTLGGMRAVIYTDVLQLLVLCAGLGASIYVAVSEAGGVPAVVAAHDAERLRVIDTSLWGWVIGGLFFYTAHFGCDQAQAQRQLSVRTPLQAKTSLLLSGVLQWPFALGCVALGLAVGALFAGNPEARALLDGAAPDTMMPIFVTHYLPSGIRGLVVIAILAATMSSLDSTLNALSAATMNDFLSRLAPSHVTQRLSTCKLSTVFWGLLVLAFALTLGGENTGLERIMRIGALFYGPILATFATGVALRRVGGQAMATGLIAGVALNATLWIVRPDLGWIWWNVIGCVATAGIALGLSARERPSLSASLRGLILWDTDLWRSERRWLPVYLALVLFFLATLVASSFLPSWLASLR
jgi:SSS family solute:Na+ symporter